MSLPDFEKLGVFYLGREVDAQGADRSALLLYDSRDLTTHAVCVGMTGSGKTGLCLSLLEEAALDGVPAIAIDPKGDLGNLLLTFPELAPADFEPWIDTAEAARKGLSTPAHAAATADVWRKGLSDWGQDGARIQRLRDAAQATIYTPGSTAGRSLSVLRSFAAPPAELRSDVAALRERIGATVAGLLGLIGVETDPLQSREHILLASVLERSWSEGRDLDLAALIHAVQKPPLERIGVFELETFYPAKERMQLAMALNNLLAAPGFAAWMEGDPLDIERLLFTEQGKPRVAIISIAHLNDAERMFVVTLLLGEVVAWMRRQSGTSSLRGLLYMDEILGYFPPTAAPPSKAPLLTLLKQARAFGLGVVLATQNPVDLDYKGLSNAGTWFIGRLQTERDKARVLEGLLSGAGAGLDKAQLETLISNLGARVFLMRNVHEDAPVLFRTRWALSYLRGPMTLQEIGRLDQRRPAVAQPSRSAAAPVAPASASVDAGRPVVATEVQEYFWRDADAGAMLKARVVAIARIHFVDKARGVDVWETRSWIAPLLDDAPDWVDGARSGDVSNQLSSTPPPDAHYAPPAAALLRAASYASWRKQLAGRIYESVSLPLLRCAQLGAAAVPAHDEAAFRARLAFSLREKRDAEVERLRQKYAPRVRTLEDQLRRADERIARERSQLTQQKMSAAVSVGTSLLGVLLGRKKLSTTNIGRVGTAARQAGRLGRESDDVSNAEESRRVAEQRLAELKDELERDIAKVHTDFDPDTVVLERIELKPRKSDIEVTKIGLVWVGL